MKNENIYRIKPSAWILAYASIASLVGLGYWWGQLVQQHSWMGRVIGITTIMAVMLVIGALMSGLKSVKKRIAKPIDAEQFLQPGDVVRIEGILDLMVPNLRRIVAVSIYPHNTDYCFLVAFLPEQMPTGNFRPGLAFQWHGNRLISVTARRAMEQNIGRA